MTESWSLGNVLGVWGHPDDEAYLSAAHMMRAVAAGYRVACVTASRGELGSTDPDRWPAGESLARVRTAEMEASLVSGSTRRFLVYRNYDALLEYNCANAYALGVALLADRITGAPPPEPKKSAPAKKPVRRKR